ncbi:MAG TPA: Rieske 2Fe-2S domain-containing protein [Anaerolineales bacterium]
MAEMTTQERFKRGAADAWPFFQYMADFVGFKDEDARTIHETRFVIEKYIPTIVAGFYAQLLRFPATRQLFQKKDGSLDQEYLELRMQHQASFWRRAASGEYDEDFARFVDYVGRAHTSQGADPNIYIPERYVIGMVGYVQQRIFEALEAELGEIDRDLQRRATKAWSAFLMVLLEMLSRSYGQPRDEEEFRGRLEIDDEAMMRLAVDTYERSLGIARLIEYKDVFVARIDDIPDGKRKIIEVDGLSIGVFHHKGAWVALHNSCLHRGGPVCEGKLEADTLTCPWHGYQYDVRDGKLLLDPSANLTRYPVETRDGEVYIRVQTLVRDEEEVSLNDILPAAGLVPEAASLAANEFWAGKLSPGEITQVEVEGQAVAVYNVDGQYFATHNRCTHAGGPLSQGRLDGRNVICPWHDSCFDVRSGEATCGPAKRAVRTYQVQIDGDVGHVS